MREALYRGEYVPYTVLKEYPGMLRELDPVMMDRYTYKNELRLYDELVKAAELRGEPEAVEDRINRER